MTQPLIKLLGLLCLLDSSFCIGWAVFPARVDEPLIIQDKTNSGLD